MSSVSLAGQPFLVTELPRQVIYRLMEKCNKGSAWIGILPTICLFSIYTSWLIDLLLSNAVSLLGSLTASSFWPPSDQPIPRGLWLPPSVAGVVEFVPHGKKYNNFMQNKPLGACFSERGYGSRRHFRASRVSPQCRARPFHDNKLENSNFEVNCPIILFVIVSQGCYNEVPQTGLLKTTYIYSLIVLEARHLKPRCLHGHAPAREEFFLAFPFKFLVAPA